MILIHWLQRLANVIPPEEGSLVVLGLTAVAAGVVAARRSSLGLVARRADLAYLVLAPLSLILLRHGALWLFVPLTSAALVSLVVAVVRSPHPDPEDTILTPGRLVAMCYLAAACLVSVVLVFADLGGYLGRVMIWEYDTSWNLVETLRAGQSTAAFVANRLEWNLGLVSTGDDALLYGTGVHLAWKLLPVSAATLRLPAALLALGCLPAAWLAGRKCAGPNAALATVVALAVTPALIYYGRYGTSLSGSLLAILLASASCCAVVCPKRPRWWAGLVAGAALFIATLGYSPARLTAVGLLVGVVLVSLVLGRQDRQRLVPLVVLAAVLCAVWLGQHRVGRTSMFVDVRGEQIFTMVSERGWLQGYLGLQVSPDELGWAQRLAIAGRLLEDTVPQLGRTLGGPLVVEEGPNDVLRADPPRLPLFQPWALVFGLWGLAISCRSLMRPPHLLLVAAVVVTIPPVMLTTRVDAHRLFVLVAPVVIWTGMGVAAAVAAARTLKTPKLLLHACAAAVLLLAAAHSARLLYDPERPVHPTAGKVLEEAARAGAPVLVIAQLEFQDLGEVVLGAAERQRRDPARAPRVLHRDLALDLADESGPTEEDLPLLVSAAGEGAAMLVPDGAYDQLADLARSHGLLVERRSEAGLSFWWITSPG